MLRQFAQKVEDMRRLIENQRSASFLLAVSGGMDSMCLLDLFSKTLPAADYAVAHCNFSLRGEESDGDQALVEARAAELGVRLFVNRFDTEAYAREKGISIEMAARDLRYAWFGQLCSEHGFDVLAVAHNANDNAETLMLNLLRGTGLNGPHGMAQVADVAARNVAIGENAQNKLKQGTRNVGIGTYAMPFVKNGERNVAIGSDCLYSTSHVNTDNQAFDNVAIGYVALHDGTMVKQNVAVGVRAMQYAEADAEDNVAMGYGAGNYAHKYNTHIGKRSGYYTKGNYNTGVGWESGSDLYVTGEQNVCVGARAGFDNTGASDASPKTINNSIAVGYNVKATDSNQARFGNSSQTIILAGKKINFNNDGTVTWESI